MCSRLRMLCGALSGGKLLHSNLGKDVRMEIIFKISKGHNVFI